MYLYFYKITGVLKLCVERSSLTLLSSEEPLLPHWIEKV